MGIRDTIRRVGSRSVEPAEGRWQATWHGTVIADSDETILVEGNHYFPPADVRQEHLEPVATTTFCPWKGTANYYDVVVDGERNAGAAWYYPEPMDAADAIKDYVAFWNGVEVTEAA
jgi:uncharacterized protein (DUF427 family)